MTSLGGTIEHLYGSFGGLYDLVCRGRDFDRQARFLADEVIRRTSSDGRYLELFAGPAHHSAALRRAGGISCVAIDASSAMQQIAIASGAVDRSRYHVCRLPELPSVDRLDGPFHGASILCYSAGYLDPSRVGELFRRLSAVLKPGARLVLELHDLDMVRSDFRDLQIKDRIVEIDGGESLRCIWPAAPLRWSPRDWVVEMDVVVQRLRAGTPTEEHRFVSIERIYAASEIEALAAFAGGFIALTPKTAADAFPGSSIVLLERA